MIELDSRLLDLLYLPDLSAYIKVGRHTVRSNDLSGGSPVDSAMEVRSDDSDGARFRLLPRQSLDCEEGSSDSLSRPTKFRPEIQFDYLLWYPKLLPVDDEIFIFHDRLNRFVRNNGDIPIIRFPRRRDINNLQLFADRTSFLLPSQHPPSLFCFCSTDHDLFSVIWAHPFLPAIWRDCQWRI